MRIAFYEDREAGDLSPLCLMRPVFELVCGQFSLRERVNRWASDGAWGALVRGFLAETYREAQPEAHVNDFDWLCQSRTLLINGRWLPTPAELSRLRADTARVIGDTVVACWVEPSQVPSLQDQRWENAVEQIARSQGLTPAEGELIAYPWDIVAFNGAQLITDFRLACDVQAPDGKGQLGEKVAMLGEASDVCVAPSATIDPFVVLDAREGPVSIAADAHVGSFTQLHGPCHIGEGSQLFRAHIRSDTTIGPVCRVGGEVEASILHGYVNKYHTGFLGHSYVCPWVNLGALTSNSDLKNDYSTVSVPLGGERIETGRTKVGCFIGDHTKTALDSIFNTGTVVGVMCLVLPSGELLPKQIPSFSRYWHGELTDAWELERSLESAAAAMGRRGQTLTAAGKRLIRFLFESSREEREQAIWRMREKT